MRITLITETWPPQINGVALTLASLAKSLAGLGHQVSVIRPRPAADAGDSGLPDTGPTAAISAAGHNASRAGERDSDGDAADNPGFDELLLPGCRLPRYPGLHFGWPAVGSIRRCWRRNRPDAIYIATEGPLGWAAQRVARTLAIPVVTGYHTRFDDYLGHYGLGLLTPLAQGWLRRFHNAAAATVVPTGELAGQLARRGFNNVTLIGRSIDTRRFNPAHRDPALRRQWRLNDDDPAIIHVGRLAPEKNLDLLLHSWRAIVSQRPGARLVMVGDGPERARLQQENPDVIFTGTLVGDDLARHYASADLFLFPSLSETFGNVTLEAMASGLAVAAFAYGAAGQHITSADLGRAIPCPGAAAGPDQEHLLGAGGGCDGDACTDAFIDAALELAVDRPLRQAIGARARQQMCQVAAENDIAASHVALFQRLITAPGAGRPQPATGHELAMPAGRIGDTLPAPLPGQGRLLADHPAPTRNQQ